MVKAKEQELILLKYALALTKLLDLNFKEEGKIQKGKKKQISSLGQLSVDTEFRPATLSNIFLGRSNLKAVTIVLILRSLGRSYTEFAEQFDHISEKEFLEFKTKIEASKKSRGRPKKK